MKSSGKKNWVQHLMQRWGLDHPAQVVLILLVFSLAGTTVVMLRKLFFALLGFDEYTAFWLKTLAYILFLFPMYQILLLFYGFVFGQFDFFWKKELKMITAIKNHLTRFS